MLNARELDDIRAAISRTDDYHGGPNDDGSAWVSETREGPRLVTGHGDVVFELFRALDDRRRLLEALERS